MKIKSKLFEICQVTRNYLYVLSLCNYEKHSYPIISSVVLLRFQLFINCIKSLNIHFYHLIFFIITSTSKINRSKLKKTRMTTFISSEAVWNYKKYIWTTENWNGGRDDRICAFCSLTDGQNIYRIDAHIREKR